MYLVSKWAKSLAILILLSFIFFSCENETFSDINNKTNFTEPFRIENGILEFKDIESYNDLIDDNDAFFNKLNSLNTEDFQSLESIYNNIHLKVWDFTEEQESEIYDFIHSQKKYVRLIDLEDGSKELVNITDVPENKFANKDFIFKIGESIYDVRDINSHLIKAIDLEYPNRMACGGTEMNAQTTVNPSGCKRDRKGSLRVRTFQINLSPTDCQGRVETKLSGQRKRLCIWINYTTALSYIGEPTVSATAGNDGDGGFLIISGPTWTGPLTCSNCFSVELLSDALDFGCSLDFELSRVNVTGTTQGIGNSTVSIICN